LSAGDSFDLRWCEPIVSSLGAAHTADWGRILRRHSGAQVCYDDAMKQKLAGKPKLKHFIWIAVAFVLLLVAVGSFVLLRNWEREQ
jgi:hypothetical protein